MLLLDYLEAFFFFFYPGLTFLRTPSLCQMILPFAAHYTTGVFPDIFFLVGGGAEVDIVDQEGRSPLHW